MASSPFARGRSVEAEDFMPSAHAVVMERSALVSVVV